MCIGRACGVSAEVRSVCSTDVLISVVSQDLIVSDVDLASG